MRNPLRWSSTFPAVILSLAGVIGVVAGVVSIRGSLTTTGSVTAAGSLNVTPATAATGFDGRPAYTMDAGDPCPPLVDGGPPACDGSPAISIDAGPAPTPVVTAGSVSVLESAWDINDKTARTIGWRLRTEGASGDSSNAPTTKLLIQSTADNSTWTTRATIDMDGRVNTGIGTQALPAYAFTSDTNSGLYALADNDLGIAINGNRMARFTASGATLENNVTVTGDLAVNGEDITCDSASAATVFNTNATSVSIGGAGDVNLSGGSGSTGCTVTGSSGVLACSGTVSAAGGSNTHAVCWKGTVLGYCSDAPNASGICTCN